MKKLKIFLITLISFMILSIFLYSQNKWISLEQITVQSTRLPKNFDGFKIMHLSDLHGQYFGKNQNDLLKKINTFKPDLIAITGDLFDSSYDDEASFSLIEQLSDYPVYFVTGNHEAWGNHFEALENLLTQVGVHVLQNKQETLEINGQSIELIGIDDPDFGSSVDNNLRVALQESESDKFKLLLSHRPEAFEIYVKSNIDLVLSGHAHGGQFRLPFIGGLVAPNQGLFPEFSEGTHTKNQTTMIISRGLGNSIIPQQLFNRPHLIEITLKAGA
ncbi:metallophosphoesterase [Turicibacter sp. H121]|uniref:metallophosphoesterase n=1 Tax=Turicibacter sp. H121 TaxID=1712675 RepID=UPI00076321A2|nr:metallophosphoesterase [Turicibacter sp. H121]AMC08494.1 phosphoesterase [Turicibacter sp. H121]MCU7200566.1 metallophosphoesterase [Turicibacter sp. H121]